MTYKAFCSRNGHHETAKRPREDWNAKILWKMRMELAYQWDLVRDEVSDVFTRLQEIAATQMKGLQDTVKGAINPVPAAG